MKRLCPLILIATMAVSVTGSPVYATRIGSPTASRSETASDVSDPSLPDPHKELRHLSRNLRLTRNQRVGVGSILQERTREIRLLFDIEPLSQEYRNALAAKVMEESNAQIETLLRSKQKQKFDRELATDRGMHK